MNRSSLVLKSLMLACAFMGDVSHASEPNASPTPTPAPAPLQRMADTLNAAVFADGSPRRLLLEGKIDVDVSNTNAGSRVRTRDAELQLTFLINEAVRAVVSAEFERQLLQSGPGSMPRQNIDLGQTIERAFIEIAVSPQTNSPIARVIIGKQRVAGPEGLSSTAMSYDDLNYAITRQDKVFGITLALNPAFLRVVDEAAISVFETGRNDLEISREVGVSGTVMRNLSSQVRARVSALYMRLPNGINETRATISVLRRTRDGRNTVWIESTYLNNNPTYVNAQFAIAAGMEQRVGPGTIGIETAFIQRYGREYAVTYNLPVGPRVTLSPEIRRVERNGRSAENRIGVRSRVRF